ncbi:topoisomerase DNA-binding C4 zinc finger domain-containing protein [Aliiglaciecola sp. LCG003]|uniref:DNA topoisomerase family protein n=1 Tax=Aliiglaciecola sp. LCG003 TaxID=3053655 RepID=UPI0025737294|nr:topoisomerase DNA-binding C4 zinc finger domain-containing protein [Aliiglaciecola sp. LCG003]WJG09480.1 topoisomerase DNA-binding C4 zinc finger domain-containing protein [Aliiglaciecola sp. LCG003]
MSKIDHSLFSGHENALDGAFGDCPECSAKLHVRRSKAGAFLGCSDYPKCTFSKPIHDNQTVELTQIGGSSCPDCGLALAIKKGRYGLFIGCTGFPECHHIEAAKQRADIHVDCPVCKSGKLLKRANKFGKSFYACDGFPSCKYALNHQPINKTCPKCDWPVMLERKSAGKTYYQCAQKECNAKVNQ